MHGMWVVENPLGMEGGGGGNMAEGYGKVYTT